MPNELGVPATEVTRALGHLGFFRVFEVASTGSTNADVAAAARAGAPEGLVLLADEQTAGRGRLARQWASPVGKSLSMSVLLRPSGDLVDWGWLSLLAGMAVTAGLQSLSGGGADVTLKWPNDVLVGGRKVCGILSERVESDEGPAAIIGIGINLSLTEGELPVPTATSLAMAGLPHGRDEVAAAVLREFLSVYRDWEAGGPPLAQYRRLCASIGAELTVTTGADVIRGVGVGIDETGRLVVDTGAGLRSFAVGDVIHATLPR